MLQSPLCSAPWHKVWKIVYLWPGLPQLYVTTVTTNKQRWYNYPFIFYIYLMALLILDFVSKLNNVWLGFLSFKFYSLDKLKLKTEFCCCWHFNFVIHFRKEDKKTFFPFKKMFSCLPFLKCIRKSSNFHLHQQKKFWFLVFGFSLSNE
jgi:hypothetical protein